jgi:hypothetical protein
MSRLEIAHTARALLACGLRPVPMIATKKCPALKGWRARASLDPEQTAALFAEAQHANAIGVTTGEGVFVIDLDRNHGDGADGIASFAALVRERGAIAPGPRVRTPAGGLHLYFACPAGRRVRSRAAIAAGVDVRGEGGLAMCPPSERDGVRYRWAPAPWECALPQAPTWLLDMVAPIEAPRAAIGSVRPHGGAASAYANAALERELLAVSSASPGARGSALVKAAYSLGGLCAAGALPAGPVAAGLIEAAAACGLVDDDGAKRIEAIVASGFKAGLARPRALPSQRGRRT